MGRLMPSRIAPGQYNDPMTLTILNILLDLLVLAISLAAISLNVISLPGNWIILILAAGLSLLHKGTHPHWAVLILILVILLLAELAEFLSGMIGTKKFGGSTAASYAAIGGAVLGGLIGIPPLTAVTLGIDHLFAAIAGAFLAAWIVELIKQKPMKEASLAALGAALGRGAGMVTKIGAGLLAWMILLVGIIWALLFK
ncbi:MAG TPA: DUF456 family protein [Phycisphaerae bacterium]|jgi:hypothetical protein